MNKWQKISIVCGIFIIGLVLANVFYINPRLTPEEIAVELWGCDIFDKQCLQTKTNQKEFSIQAKDGGLVVEVPRYSLPPDKKVEVVRVSVPVDSKDQELILSKIYEVKTPADFLVNWAVIKINYQESDLPAGIEEEDLTIARLDGSKWRPISSTVDTANNFVQAKVDHFSKFAIKSLPPSFQQRQGGVSKIEGTIKVKDLGLVKGAKVLVYEEESDGSLKLVQGAETETTDQGRYHINLDKRLTDKFKQGKIYIKVEASNQRIDVQDKDGFTYNIFELLSPDDPSRLNFEVSLKDEDLKAFQIYNQFNDLYGFYSEIEDALRKGEVESEVAATIFWALTTQVKVVYPSTEATGYDISTLEGFQDYIYIEDLDLYSLKAGDSQGDTCAHEYAHFITRAIYGIWGWKGLSSSGAGHKIGDFVTPNDAFKEDIAYFLESIFDGMKHKDLEDADPYAYIDKMKQSIDQRKQRVAEWFNRLLQAKSDTERTEIQKNINSIILKANRDVEILNKFITEFNKDHTRLEGFGANILWEVYNDNQLGSNKEFRLRKVLYLLTKKPTNIAEFYLHWLREYPNEKTSLNNILNRLGAFAKFNLYPKINWQDYQKIDPKTGGIGGQVKPTAKLSISISKQTVIKGSGANITVTVPSNFKPPFRIAATKSRGTIFDIDSTSSYTNEMKYMTWKANNEGEDVVKIRAVDSAGNIAEGEVTFNICEPNQWDCGPWSSCEGMFVKSRQCTDLKCGLGTKEERAPCPTPQPKKIN